MERDTAVSTELLVLMLLASLVSAIGVLTVDGKVDQFTGQVGSLQDVLVTRVTTPGIHPD